MKSKFLTLLIIALSAALFHTNKAQGGTLITRFGPPAVGSGGPNPLGIPPGASDIDITWLSKSGYEYSLSVAPGLFFGVRSDTKPGPYVSAGGGVVISAQGAGLGLYSAFGADFFCGSLLCMNAEYKQAIGIAGKRLTSPYAVRLGVSMWF